ncbi:MAG: XdhC family protein [Chloroflexi bacterium]|nr:XdhC family protein [Chloroflexota bacterium]
MNSLFASLAELERSGDSAALCTIIREHGSVPRHVGSKMIVFADGRIEGTVGGGEMESRVIREAQAALREGSTRIIAYKLSDPKAGDPGVCGGEMEIFVEPIQPQPTLLVIGGGHVGKALVHLGKWLGFRVALSDDRPEFCSPDSVPGADVYLPVSMAELPRQFKFNSQTYIVMPTRGLPFDVDGLPYLLDLPHAYLGVIGSRRRWLEAVKRMEANGVAADKLAGVHAPMGLELNAETPEEIALSILAEIVMLKRGGTGEPMKMNNMQAIVNGEQ